MNMNWPVESLLSIHVTVVSVVLTIFARMMWVRGLFRWTTAGFWAWAAFALYLVLNPLVSVWQKDVYVYQLSLSIAGGSDRVFIILTASVLGITAFYTAYMRTQKSTVTWNLSEYPRSITIPMIWVSIPFFLMGIYSLLTYRASLIVGKNLLIDSGRFTGEVSGYEFIGYLFLFVPIVLILLSEKRLFNSLGIIVAGGFIFLALPNGWSRYALVSMALAITVVVVVKQKRSWTPIYLLAGIVVLALTLQARGHEQWTLQSIDDQFLRSASNYSLIHTLTGADTSMLSSWYIESFVKDKITGYDFGLSLLNYTLMGWIPGRVFPQKYFLVDWLHSQQPMIPSFIGNFLVGAKSSLLGSFYANGGLIGVLLFALIIGFLCRKLDGMLSQDSPVLVKAVGISWLSVLWIVWGSADFWGLTVMGVLALPALAMWFIAPKGKFHLEKQIHSLDVYKTPENIPEPKSL